MTTTTRLSLGPFELAVHRSNGTGASVVLLHGNSCSSRAFSRQLSGPLGRQFSLAALDLPGHGESSDALAYSLPIYAKALVDTVHHLALSNAVFVGWSLGGHVLLEAAADLPRAAGVMIVATPPLGKPPDFAAAFRPHPAGALLFRPEFTTADCAEFAAVAFGPGAGQQLELVDDLRRADGRARTGLGASIPSGDYRDELAAVHHLRCPLAIVLGEHDPLIQPSYFARLQAPTLWRGSVQTIPAAGHAPHWQNPQAFDALLAAFVADCSQPT